MKIAPRNEELVASLIGGQRAAKFANH